MSINNLASIFIEKTILPTRIEVFQIASVFIKDKKFRYFYKFVKNNLKHSNNAVEFSVAIKQLFKIVGDSKIILKNDDNNDFLILNESCLRFLNKNFDNFVYDISKNAEFLGFKKSNLEFLCSKYNISFKNDKGLPTSVFKAQKVFVIGAKMFNLGKDNV
ncbi:MAG: hypothetical protein HUJ42_00080 [Malacoplasma sp.]|nr:hypothetical protein [Malacoplasma sp.]